MNTEPRTRLADSMAFGLAALAIALTILAWRSGIV